MQSKSANNCQATKSDHYMEMKEEESLCTAEQCVSDTHNTELTADYCDARLHTVREEYSRNDESKEYHNEMPQISQASMSEVFRGYEELAKKKRDLSGEIEETRRKIMTLEFEAEKKKLEEEKQTLSQQLSDLKRRHQLEMEEQCRSDVEESSTIVDTEKVTDVLTNCQSTIDDLQASVGMLKTTCTKWILESIARASEPPEVEDEMQFSLLPADYLPVQRQQLKTALHTVSSFLCLSVCLSL